MTTSAEATPVAAERPHGFKPWLMVAVCLLGISTGPAAFGLASIGLFIETFEKDYGWSRAAVSSAVSLMMLFTALSLPVVGRLVDRFGVKAVLVPSVVALGLCLIAVPFVAHLWQFIALYICMGTLAAGSNSVPYMRVLASWFNRSRGLAIGIAGSGTGLGFAYVPLVTQFMVSHYGWRSGYICLGLIMLCVTLPLAIFVLREQPHAEEAALTDQPPAAMTQGKSLTESVRGRDFWVLGAIFVSVAFVLYGVIPHLVPMIMDRGVDAATAAQIASIFGLATFGGRILIGFLVDRFDARRIALIFFALSAFGLPLLALDLPVWAFLGAALLLGGSLGAEVDMLAYLVSRYFGLRCFAQIFGLLFGAVMLAMGLGPVAFGAVFDATGSYGPMLMLGAPVCLLAVGLTLLLRPYAERRRGGPVSVT